MSLDRRQEQASRRRPEAAVLILAPDQDRLAHAAQEELARRAVPVLRVDPADLACGWDLGWVVLSGAGFAGPQERRLRLEELRSVLTRPGGWTAQDGSDEEDREYMEAEVAATMFGLFAGLDCRVINRPAPGGIGRLILREAAEVAASGLEPTPMLMTSGAQAARTFFRDVCDGRALIAPVSGCAPPKLIEGEDGEGSFPTCASGPVVLQAFPAGTSESVWVVGTHTVCASPIDPAVGAACVRAASRLRLELARFDLVLGAELPVCVEISQVPDLPSDGGACAELVHALCDRLATGSVAT